MENNLSMTKIFNEALSTPTNLGPATEIVIQATPFCNLRCRYCYLSVESRSNRSKMPTHMPADILSFLIDQGIANRRMFIRWHAGEPLAAGLDFYQEAIDKMESALPSGYSLCHSVQTNATYINDDWCQFFLEKKFFVGVSIDGPDFLHDVNRVTRSQHGTHRIVMRGIEYLQKNGVYFDVISVVTEKTLKHANEFYDFFEELGVNFVGLNIEETESANQSQVTTINNFQEKYRSFFHTIYQRQRRGNVMIREIKERSHAITHGSEQIISILSKPFFMFTVDHQGNFSTFDPELLGQTHPLYGSFNLGNIYQDSIKNVISSEKYQKIYRDITDGVQQCQSSCDYFFLCGGGAPGNKLYENGSFNSTTTHYCQTKIQIPIEIILPQIHQQHVE